MRGDQNCLHLHKISTSIENEPASERCNEPQCVHECWSHSCAMPFVLARKWHENSRKSSSRHRRSVLQLRKVWDFLSVYAHNTMRYKHVCACTHMHACENYTKIKRTAALALGSVLQLRNMWDFPLYLLCTTLAAGARYINIHTHTHIHIDTHIFMHTYITYIHTHIHTYVLLCSPTQHKLYI